MSTSELTILHTSHILLFSKLVKVIVIVIYTE